MLRRGSGAAIPGGTRHVDAEVELATGTSLHPGPPLMARSVLCGGGRPHARRRPGGRVTEGHVKTRSFTETSLCPTWAVHPKWTGPAARPVL